MVCVVEDENEHERGVLGNIVSVNEKGTFGDTRRSSYGIRVANIIIINNWRT